MKLFAWLASLLTLFGMSAMAQEELPPEDELFAFVYDSLSSSIRGKWEKAWMDADVSMKDGVEDIKVEYFYLPSGSAKPKKFEVSNTFGPPNAASYLKKHAERAGKPMSKFRIEIAPGGKLRVIPL
jgi:hypothetical protein